MTIHDRAYTRAKTWSKATRKYNIDRDKTAGRWPLWYNNLHQYANNKIHCNCGACCNKTNPRNKQGCGPKMNWSIADQRKLDDMNLQIEELNN